MKVTGKTKDGLSVGLLQSVTDDEHANVWFNGLESRVPVAPTTNYVVGRVQKDWNKGNSILGGMFTSTHRWLPDDVALHQLPTDSFTGAVDATQFFGDRSYVFEGKGVFSRIAGDASAIRALQTNPVHYYQRPDASHLGVDQNATSMLGNAGTVRVARYGKSKWLWSESARWMSPGLELNDVGYLRQADVILNEASLEFKEIEPHGVFRSYGFSVTRDDIWDFGGLKTIGSTSFLANGAFQNLWTVWAGVTVLEAPTDTRLLRGGPAMTTSGRVAAVALVNSDPSRRVNVQASMERDFVMDGDAAKRQRDHAGQHAAGKCVLSLGDRILRAQRRRPAIRGHRASRRFAAIHPGPARSGHTRPHVPSQRVRLARFHDSVLRQPVRLERRLRDVQACATTPRASEYADRFHAFSDSEIAFVPQANAYRVTEGSDSYAFGNPNFDFRQFRSNLVARWEYKPGSSLYVVWSQDRTDQEVFGRSLTSSLDALRLAPATNVFLVKMSYWFGR